MERLLRPFRRFAKLEAAGGILLITCTIAALVWANSPWAGGYDRLWHIHLTFGLGRARLSETLHFWINDGLMAVFFLFVGLEIKREALVGELASLQKAALPILAAVGGMLVPAAFYCFINWGHPGLIGWGVPMATDIAFALGILALLGERVPGTLKVFLAALAIADDIGAVLVIAVFYTETISWICLGVAGFFFAALLVMNRLGARHPFVYFVLGLGLWLAFLKSGVHSTVSGILLAFAIPARQRIDGRVFLLQNEKLLADFRAAEEAGDCAESAARKSAAVNKMSSNCLRVESPMLRFEHALAPWIRHLVMPLFALANAGVALDGDVPGPFSNRIGLGILCGLVIGKPLGIAAFTWFGVRSRIAFLPAGVAWRQIIGVGLLAGIGFTMSLFVASLAFDFGATLATAKVGILAASLLAGVLGAAVLSRR